MLPNCERNKTEEEHDEFDKLFGDLYSEDDPFRLMNQSSRTYLSVFAVGWRMKSLILL